MECERLKKLIKNWYVQVQDESMAPARMVDFMNSHTEDCLTCMADPVVEIEIKRITEIVLPPAKIPKAVREVKPPNKPEAENPATADDVDPEDVETKDVDTEDDVDDVDPEDIETKDVDTEDDVDDDDSDNVVVDIDIDEDVDEDEI